MIGTAEFFETNSFIFHTVQTECPSYFPTAVIKHHDKDKL